MLTRQELIKRISRVPQVSLGHFPTPLEPCPRLSETLGGPQIFMKREDCSGLAFGGNKVRQLTFTLGEGVSQGADTIVHGAASQSNHCRQTAAACSKLNLKCYLRLARDHKSVVQGNVLLDYLSGADVEFVDVPFGPKLENLKIELAEKLKNDGLKPYVVTSPRSTALAAVAFTWCVAEIHAQQIELGIDADWIYTSSVGGTQAGLVLGTKSLDMKLKPYACAPVHWEGKIDRIRDAANSAASILDLDIMVNDEEIINTDDYIGEAYGYLTPEGISALKLVARTEGIILDPVYTSKAMACLIDHIKEGRFKPSDVVIFLHTGGTPALFAYQEELTESLQC